jgi:transcriptional regulator with XRE-family HTH domain
MGSTQELRRLPRSYSVALGQRLRSVRAFLHLKQRDFAALTGYGPDRVSKFETGVSPPNVRSLAHIALTLGLPVDPLLPELDFPEGPNRDLYLLYRRLWFLSGETRRLAASVLRSVIEQDPQSNLTPGEKTDAPRRA